MRKKFFKFVAKVMLVTLTYQLVFPACAYALTSGPSQPEVQSFEPVGTTEMVDMFSGDFNYNIPLMDVEGYPINIFYHSGVGIEQEASWVGLGWNINPGEINRTVRGLPDDFKGDVVKKYLHIKQEHEIRVGRGNGAEFELFGNDKVKLSLGVDRYIGYNNYRGISAGISGSAGLSTPVGSVGLGLGIGTQSGADIDYSLSTPNLLGKLPYGVSTTVSSGFNSRSGLKDITISSNINATVKSGAKENKKDLFKAGTSYSNTIPIGLQNYVPANTSAMKQLGFQLQIKGGHVQAGFSNFKKIDGMYSNVNHEQKLNNSSYGYLYLENANKENILDFSREKDGVYNKTLKNLPPSSLSYDVYSVNGQGTGGMFRPFRNDIGTIFDPYIASPESKQKSLQVEYAAGNGGTDYFELGNNYTWINTNNISGAWEGVQLGFASPKPGSLFENVFFKQAGELSYNQQQEATSLFNTQAQYLNENLSTLTAKSGTASLPAKSSLIGVPILWDGSTLDRSSRSTNISYQTVEQIMKIPEMDITKKILDYSDGVKFYQPVVNQYDRYANGASTQKHHIGEFTQTTPDGRRYVYGIPALNNLTREVTFSVNENTADLNKGYVKTGGNDKKNNGIGRDHFYSSTVTPAHAHAYLLTALLSADYVDILGDGPTDDDLGSYVKYNYTRKSKDYRWRTPYETTEAQYNPGFWSDDQDGKGNYIVGSREQWYVRSIETKNYVAEFYTSARLDAKGIKDAITKSGSDDEYPEHSKYSQPIAADKNDDISYKLDSIKLYNKHDRYINKENAIPVKTVIFNFSYQLCKGIPNSTNPATVGKLTLEKIFIKYGNSHKNLLSPYVFTYKNSNNYNFAAKDRWGNYKKVVSGIYNYEFPYTDQPNNSSEEATQNDDLADWNLNEIKLPSGGKIHIDYESDDYSFVQDKRSMQMIRIEGVGNSKKMKPKNNLYNSLKDINDYVYFKRRKNKENATLSLKDNYLEGETYLYYSFALDIANIGKFDRVSGYAKIEEVGQCEDNDNYAYIKLKRDPANELKLHPATILGINTGRQYIPHIFHDGSSINTTDIFGLFKSLIAKIPELVRTTLGRNPFIHFIRTKKKARIIKIENSWVRLHTPGLTKKGGGIRVKKLQLSDNWEQISGNQESRYGKQYDYTINHKRYGKISSGVASYEPMIGADENPFKQPIPYSADAGRGLPSAEFFQEEPFGESFFPPATVGYSSVKVTSIHQQYGRSAQALDEYLFFTAQDYPIRVDYTDKNPKETLKKGFRKHHQEAEVKQGYVIVMNDMHGKPKAVNNYVIYRENSEAEIKEELITGNRYYYNDNGSNQLNNNVLALVRKRGTPNFFEIKNVILGQDMDFAVDSRYRLSESNMNNVMLNVNVLNVLSVPTPVPTVWYNLKQTRQTFKSLVSTKIIQQYGILRAIESIDHQAKTTTENIVYDAETGIPILKRSNNEFNEYTADLSYPAHLAYEGMRPAYTNDAYNEETDLFVVNKDRDGFLYTNNLERFSPGDELLVQCKDGSTPKIFKLWILGKEKDPIGEDYASVCLRKFHTETSSLPDLNYTITRTSPSPVEIKSGTIENEHDNLFPGGDNFGCSEKIVKTGTHTIEVKMPSGVTIYSTSITLGKNQKAIVQVYPACVGCPSSNIIGPTTSSEPIIGDESADYRCALKVAPRYKDKFAGTTNVSTWPTVKTKFTNVSVKVLRSGRRNNLNQNIQQTLFTASKNNFDLNHADNLSKLFYKTEGILSTTANTFTNDAQIFAPFLNQMDISGDHKYGKFNPFVLGCRGNYRPLATYTPITSRDYQSKHSRYDGMYQIPEINQFWSFHNGRTVPEGLCDASTDLFREQTRSSPQFWKMASKVTRYDIFGNALEEQDAIGNYSAAQYGYNAALPVSVAANAQYQQFMFDGFEDYNMLLAEKTAALFLKGDLYSALAMIFGNPKVGASFSAYAQNYHLRELAPSSSVVILSKEASHSGFFSMKTTAAADLVFSTGNALPNELGPFKFAPSKKYLVQLWVKTTSGDPIIASDFTATTPCLSTIMQEKTPSIDGWYQLEATVDLTGSCSTATAVHLQLPPNVYVDDIRVLPINANMKSFVYDPISFKLVAQLDENHMTTFFEYDQEGLLVRTKKETVKGIVTVSESRRANAKN